MRHHIHFRPLLPSSELSEKPEAGLTAGPDYLARSNALLRGVWAVSFGAMRRITIEDVARLPRPGTTAPELFSFSPDGKTLTFLAPPEGRSGLERVLWAHDVASGEQRILF